MIPAALLGLAVACGTPVVQKNLAATPSENLTEQAAPSNALSRVGWKVLAAPASANNPAVILDGNESTVWTSSGNQANGLGGLRIDLGAERQFGKVVLEVGAGSQNFLRSYNVYLSNDANSWLPLLKSGVSNSGTRLEIDLGPRSGRYLTIQNGYANPGKPWSVAELWLKDSIDRGPESAPASNFVVKRALNVSTLDSQYRGFPLPDAELSRVTRAGFDTIRLVTDVALSPAEGSRAYIDPDGSFNAYGKQKVDAAINGALRGGLNVIVDIHTVRNFPGTSTTFNQAILCGDKLAAFEKFLTQVAVHLTKYPRSKVALELMNEPNDNGCPGLEASYAAKLKRMYDAARRGSRDMMLIISGLANSSPFQLSGLNTFIASNPDKNTIITVHYYGPLEFSHQGATYIADQKYLNCFQNIPYPSKPLSASQRQAVVDRVKAKVAATPSCGGPGRAVEAGNALGQNYLNYNNGAGYDVGDIDYVAQQTGLWAKARGIPASRIFLGEFGVQGSGTSIWTAPGELEVVGALPADRAAWTRDVRTSFERYGFSWAYFAYSGGSYSILQDRNFPTVNYAAWDPRITAALGIATP